MDVHWMRRILAVAAVTVFIPSPAWSQSDERNSPFGRSLTRTSTGSHDPFVGQVEKGRAWLELTASGVDWTIGIELHRAEPVGGSSSAYALVTIDGCHRNGCSAYDYVKVLDPETVEVSDDGSSGRLESKLGGLPFVVEWVKEGCVTEVWCSPGFWLDVTPGGAGVLLGTGDIMPVNVSLFGLECSAGGSMSNEKYVSAGPPPPPPPESDPGRPRGFPSTRQARCPAPLGE